MKKALISPGEYILDYEGSILGYRIADVCDAEFEVAQPLYWVYVDDTTIPDGYYWDGSTAVIKTEPPVVPEPTPPSQADSGGPTIVA